jgi:hypothetical protein
VKRQLSYFIILLALTNAAFGKYSGGSGQPGTPYLIKTPDDLNSIGLDENDWDKHFKMIADINLIDYKESNFNIIGRWVYWGNSDNRPFTGVFDGNDHVISNFSYDDAGRDSIGLFGYIYGNDAVIKDLKLLEPNVRGDIHIGALAGSFEYATISGCGIEGGGISGNECVGGMVGYSKGVISKCYASSNVSGVGWIVGGLCGLNELGSDISGSIIDSYATGNVTGSDYYTGGLCGYNGGDVNNCYATGSVIGYYGNGGLCGYNLGVITNCFSTGNVTGNTWTGGLCGQNYYSDIYASFWDVNTSGQTDGVGENLGGGTVELFGRTTAEMQTRSTFADAGWDMVNVWDIGENQTYPFLRTHLPGDINKDDIVNLLDLAILAEHWLENM